MSFPRDRLKVLPEMPDSHNSLRPYDVMTLLFAIPGVNLTNNLIAVFVCLDSNLRFFGRQCLCEFSYFPVKLITEKSVILQYFDFDTRFINIGCSVHVT